MAPKFALFTKGSKLPLNQGFQNRFLVTTVSRQALDILKISMNNSIIIGKIRKQNYYAQFYLFAIMFPNASAS